MKLMRLCGLMRKLRPLKHILEFERQNGQTKNLTGGSIGLKWNRGRDKLINMDQAHPNTALCLTTTFQRYFRIFYWKIMSEILLEIANAKMDEMFLITFVRIDIISFRFEN